MLDLHNYNIHPAEDCEMFVIAAFTIIEVKLQFAESILSVLSTIYIYA